MTVIWPPYSGLAEEPGLKVNTGLKVAHLSSQPKFLATPRGMSAEYREQRLVPMAQGTVLNPSPLV